MLLIEVNDFFNVRGNMNDKQIRLTAELILDNDNFYDLTLGNIKACFRQHMMQDKIYDRLDGNIIIGWLREFKSDFADSCENASIGRERTKLRDEAAQGGGAISHKVYMAMLEARANDGDKEAEKILDGISRRAHIGSPDERRKKELDFFKYKHDYLKKKGYYDKKKDNP